MMGGLLLLLLFSYCCSYYCGCLVVYSLSDALLFCDPSSAGKESACNEGDPGSIPGSGRSPGGGHGNPVQYSCLIPWTEEPGELQSMGLQRVRHD